MLTLEFGLSKKDSDDKSIVVQRGLKAKCRKGWRPGVAPTGYFNDRATESGFRRILTDHDRLPFITKVFEMFRAGTPVTEIHRIANKTIKNNRVRCQLIQRWRFTDRNSVCPQKIGSPTIDRNN
jgi:hypothetical protein